MVSIGLVNKVVRYLREEDLLLLEEDGGFRIRDPLKLLLAWRDAYRFQRHARLAYFTFKQGKALQEELQMRWVEAKGLAAYAVFTAADTQAPHVRQAKTWMYVRGQDLELFEQMVEAKRVDSGENLIVLVPEDEGVFHKYDELGTITEGLGYTNPLQTYVDLCHAGGRGKEAAEALLEQIIKPNWKQQGFPV